MYVFYVNKNKAHAYVFYVKHVHSMDIECKTHVLYVLFFV